MYKICAKSRPPFHLLFTPRKCLRHLQFQDSFYAFQQWSFSYSYVSGGLHCFGLIYRRPTAGFRVLSNLGDDFVLRCGRRKWPSSLRSLWVHRVYSSYWIPVWVSHLVLYTCLFLTLRKKNSDDRLDTTLLHNLTKTLILHPVGQSLHFRQLIPLF